MAVFGNGTMNGQQGGSGRGGGGGSVPPDPHKRATRAVTATTTLIAAATAGIVSRTAIAPIERVKIIFQVDTTQRSFRGVMGMFSELARKEGILSLWKGNSAAVIRVVPYLSMQFLCLEKTKEAIKTQRVVAMHDRPRLTSLLAGSLAGMTAVVTTYPLDVVRARLALQQESLAGHTSRARQCTCQYRGMFDALVKIPREEGMVALYRGVAATVTGAAPYTGLKFGAYETFKISLQGFLDVEEKDLPGWMRVGAGASAGLVALTIVYPFDVIRRRMQTHRGGAKYASIVSAFSTIYKQEGLTSGLYRGLTLNYLRTLPNVAIYLSLYDFLKAYMLNN